jgi:hypothetical protein
MAAVLHHLKKYSPDFHKSPGLKVLDIFCCSGVGAEGYIRAGASVVGIDKHKPSFYPDTFIESDALNISIDFLQQFHFVHMSPPCQGYSRTKALTSNLMKYDLDMIEWCRNLLTSAQVAGVIENVTEAPLRKDFMLCGSMFGLEVMRHRAFECVNWQPFYSPRYCHHPSFKSGAVTLAGEFRGSKHEAAEAMGCYASRTRWELKQGIPPSYTEFIFKVFKSQLTSSPVKDVASESHPKSALFIEEKNLFA